MNRQLKKIFKIFCEGDTEYNYFDLFKKRESFTLALRPVNMEGGGYTNFNKELRKDGNSNCLAKFVIIDGDRAHKIPEEKEKLSDLIQYCINQNKNGKIPHILIVDYPDFEYVACFHSPKYNGQNRNKFIMSEFGYKSIDDFKADEKVFDKLNSNGNSYKTMLSKIPHQKVVVTNSISVKKNKFEINVKSVINRDAIGINDSNIRDLFDVLSEFR